MAIRRFLQNNPQAQITLVATGQTFAEVTKQRLFVGETGQ